MSWHPSDPRAGGPSSGPWQQPPTGPSELPPWAGQPIPSYVAPAPGRTSGPQDHVPGYPPPPPSTPTVRYADWGERVGATLLDWVVLLAPALLLGALGDVVEPLDSLGGLAWLGLAGYVAWLNGSKGQSPGKALMGLKVVRQADGSTLGGPVGLVRSLVLMLMLVLTGGLLWALSLLWPCWDRRRQTLHDKMLGAVVVAGYPTAKVGRGLFRP